MPNSLIRQLLILGGLAIAGIIFIQSFLVLQTWDSKRQEFDHTVNIVLLKVAAGIAKYNGSELPKRNMVQRRSNNLYFVNINSAIDANILEEYLYKELEIHGLQIDFEYAVYDCATDNMVYGDYCQIDENPKAIKPSSDLPKFEDLIYYFVVKFPSRESFLVSNMWQTVLFSFIALLAVIFFIYAIWIILRQKHLTELQKDFINNMTHEFKTPISSIKLASDVLLKSKEIQSNARLTQYAGIIKDQNIRLNNQVEKVLNIARLEKNQIKLKKEQIELNSFLRKIIEDENLKFKNQSGEIISELSSTDLFINADLLHLTNVITNILDNSLKYNVNDPQTHLKTTMTGQFCELSIRDNGIGIKEDDQKKLFTKFFRVSTGDVHDVKGFGLGLFYVKNICDEHGWKINLESQIKEGTCITITIPIEKNN